MKHWCVTEKGHTNTRRIHLHGLFYAGEGQTKWQLTKLLYENWIDGYKYYGRYVNEKTINYISKYMTKKDKDNPDYISIVLCSKGLGANYAKENQLKTTSRVRLRTLYAKRADVNIYIRFLKPKKRSTHIAYYIK